MRIQHIITRMILGGAQENTLLSCVGQLEAGDEVELVTGPARGPEGELLEEARKRGVPVRLVPSLRRAIGVRDFFAYRALRRAIREYRPEVVHTHSSKAGVLGRLAARREGVPAVVHTIHGLPFHPYESGWRNRLYIRAERRAADACDRLVSVADAMTEQAVAAGVAPREKFTTVYSGMDTKTFLEAPHLRGEMRVHLGLAPDDLVAVTVARLFHLKGHAYVVEAAPELCARFPNLRFLFVGDGVLRRRFQARVRALRLADRFVFAGLVPSREVPAYLAAADLVVHPSLREGLARALPQGMLAGLPAVSFDVDGAREVVRDGETGYLVPPRDVARLTTAVARLAQDPDARVRLGARGRELCRARFDWRVMVRSLRAIYMECLAGKRVAGS